MIRTIVVATDGSEHSMKAVELAADIAGKYGARIVLVHALLRDSMPDGLRAAIAGGEVPPDVAAELERLAEAPIEAAAMAGVNGPIFVPASGELLKQVGEIVLAKAREAVAAHGVSAVDSCLADGRPSDQILEAAERERADMIVMGSRGFGDLKGLLLGSVSHKVSHLSKCTCVTVR